MINQEITSGPTNGALIAHGGGNVHRDHIFRGVFRELAGGSSADFVYIPSAISDEDLNGTQSNHLDPNFASSRFGFKKAIILHTRSRKEANSTTFVKPLMGASAVFITGGRQWRLADAYLGTKTHEELRNLLQRGGVIAGSSAGATIQGSLLVRGNSQPDDNTIMMGDHQEGFGFLMNAAIDQHLLEKNRQHDMLQVVKRHPELLGIGIDENTSILVQHRVMTVLGRSCVAVYDMSVAVNSREDKREDKRLCDQHGKISGFCLLHHGDRYDLGERSKI